MFREKLRKIIKPHQDTRPRGLNQDLLDNKIWQTIYSDWILEAATHAFFQICYFNFPRLHFHLFEIQINFVLLGTLFMSNRQSFMWQTLSLPYMELDAPVSCSHRYATGTYLKPNSSGSHLRNLVSYHILTSAAMYVSHKWPVSFRHSHKTLFFPSLHVHFIPSTYH
jgi:hypothetical protein